MDTVPFRLDYAAFATELDALRARLQAEHGEAAVDHLRQQARWGRLCTALGYATAWFPNPVAPVLIALGMSARWAIVAHHVRHRALDRVDGVADAETSRGFAMGWRRWLDWLDWLEPAAWDHEHNKLHHYHLGEVADPDVAEVQLDILRVFPAPRWVKHLVLVPFVFTWKASYYAPNIFALARREQRRKAENRPFDAAASQADISRLRAWWPFHADGAAFWGAVVLPYVALRFVLIPACFLPLGVSAAGWVLASSVVAELLTNLHTFAIIVPNHGGDDLYRFDRPTRDRAEFYVRQVTGSVNYRTGGALNDFLHGFLNYQIEHHLWPDLPPHLYQLAAPEVKEICARHGVPYVQEGVLRRVRKVVDIMTGHTSMQRGATLSRKERDVERASA